MHLLAALRNQGISEKYVHLIKKMYTHSNVTIITDKVGTVLQVKKGMKHGDSFSSYHCYLIASSNKFLGNFIRKIKVLAKTEKLTNL